MQTHGVLNLQKLPDSELTTQADGLISGTLQYKLEYSSQRAAAEAKIGTVHPDDGRVILIAGSLVRGRLDTAQFHYNCLGLAKDPTLRVVQICPQVSTTAIEAHPKFTTVLAGTADEPLNGAIFDEDGNFVGFGAGPLLGVSSFYDGGVIIRSTYYTRKPPSFSKNFTLTSSTPNVPHMEGVVKWLRMPPASDQVAGTDFFKVTEELLSVLEGGLPAAELIYAD